MKRKNWARKVGFRNVDEVKSLNVVESEGTEEKITRSKG